MSKAFRDLVVFQFATDLMVEVYTATKSFPPEERYGLVSQLRRASVGVMAQIAEGEGRVTPGERRQLLSQARGSLFEVEAECIAAQKLGFLDEQQTRRLSRRIVRTGKALTGFINWVRRLESQKPRNPVTQQPIRADPRAKAPRT